MKDRKEIKLLTVLVICALGLMVFVGGCQKEKFYPEEQFSEFQAAEAKKYYDEGIGYMKSSRYTDAINSFEQAIEIKPDYLVSYSALGHTYNELGRYEEVIQIYNDAILKCKNVSHDIYKNMALAYEKIGSFQKAIIAYKKGITIMPDAKAYYNLGGNYIIVGDYNKAIESYEQAIDLEHSFIPAYYNLGSLYSALNRYEDAIKMYKKVLDIIPDKKALEISPNYAELRFNLGLAYLALDPSDKESAIEEYELLKNMDKDKANEFLKLINTKGNIREKIQKDQRVNLAETYINTGRYDTAINIFKEIISNEPYNAQAYCGLGVVYGMLGSYDESIKHLKQVIAIKSDYIEAHTNLGLAYGNLGRWNEALEAYKQATRIKPDYADAHHGVGWVYINLGRYNEAIEPCKQAIFIKPDYTNAHFDLGSAYLQLGDKESALKQYEIVKTLDKKIAEELLEEINK